LIAAVYVYTPHFNRSGPSKTSGIIDNLRQLDGATQQWAIEHGQTGGVIVTWEDLAPYLRRTPNLGVWVKPVAGEKYTLKTVKESPEAELTRELEGRPKGTVLRLGSNLDVEIILPNPQGEGNGRQPFSSETNRTSAAAASGRSP